MYKAFAVVVAHVVTLCTPIACAAEEPSALAKANSFTAAKINAGPLPQHLRGEWRYTSPTTLNSYAGELSVEIDEERPDGQLRGRLSFYGQTCYANNVPMVGTREADTVTFHALIGVCGQGKFTLTQRGVGHYEGPYEIDGAGAATSTASLEARQQ